MLVDKSGANIYNTSMKTKITIKDIAREAGVSVATVSYVLNNRAEERISEKTRKKVLQIVNLLNYTPNQSAKALATSRSRNIVAYLPFAASPFKRAEQLFFLNCLSDVLHSHDYNLIHLCPKDVSQVENADAIICYDVNEEEFRAVGEDNLIPLIAFDCQIDVWLFFQVLSDYKRILSEAEAFFKGEDFVLAMLPVLSENLRRSIEAVFPNLMYIESIGELQGLEGKNVLVVEDTLNLLLSESCNLLYSPSITKKKLEKTMECIKFAIDRVQDENHNIIL